MAARLTIRKTEHLAGGGPLERLIDLTFPGMAHFAGTGPADRRCGGCRHWAGTAMRKQAPCGKYLQLTSRTGRDVTRQPRPANTFCQVRVRNPQPQLNKETSHD